MAQHVGTGLGYKPPAEPRKTLEVGAMRPAWPARGLCGMVCRGVCVELTASKLWQVAMMEIVTAASAELRRWQPLKQATPV